MILDLAVDDYTGLWELVWGVQSSTQEDERRSNIALLRTELEELVAQGAVAFFRGINFNGDEVAVSVDEVPGLLANNQSWEPPEPNSSHLRLLATEEGQRKYEQLFRT